MSVTTLPTPPSRSGRPSSFGAEFPPFLAALPLFRQELQGIFNYEFIDFSGFSGSLITGLPAFNYMEIAFLMSSAASIGLSGRFQPGSASGLLTATASYAVMGVSFLSIAFSQNVVSAAGIRCVSVTGVNFRAGRIRLYKMGTSNKYGFRLESSWPRSSGSSTNYRASGTFVLPSRMTQFFFHNDAVVAPTGLLQYRWR